MWLFTLQDLTMEKELEAVNGRRVRAIEVFAHALRFFREHALKVKFKTLTYIIVAFIFAFRLMKYKID